MTAEYDTTPTDAAGLLQDFVHRATPWRETLSGFVASGVAY